MATSSASNRTDEQEKMSTEEDEEQEIIQQLGWKALFGFTTTAHLPTLSVGLVAALVAALTLPAIAVVYGLIFRQFADFGAGTISAAVMLQNSSRYCLYLTAFAALNWLANSIYFITFLTFGELQARSARNRIFNTLLWKNMAWYDTRETGVAAFLPAVQMQIRDLQMSVSQPLGEAVQCFIQAIGSLGVAFYFSWNLTLVTIASVPLVYVVMAYLSGLLSKSAHEQSNKLQQALKYITNVIHNIEQVKSFNGERFELQRYTNIIARAGGLYNRQASLRSGQLGFMQFITLSIFVQGFWYGSHLVQTGDRNAGQVVTTFWAALMAVQGITGFLPQFIVLQKGRVAAARLRALVTQISRTDTNNETGGQQRPERCAGDIEFREVSFSYPSQPDQTALRDISMSIAAGQTTFVIGRSGSGKSTLGQLLVRFYQPSSGAIRLDDVPLEQLDVRWLREQITLVEQHSVLFNETIRRNITLGKKGDNVSLLAIQEAVEFAILQQMIRDLPNGFDTQMGLKGSSLSGGQKQRMALARARLRNTPVLILDESTSALDYITRVAILDAIRAWRKGKTTIIITHDTSQILPDDFVYVMDQAEVLEKGTRRVLEAERDSAFRTFLNLPELDDANLEVSPVDETGDIMSLYADSWGIPSLPGRPSSAIFFRESFLSPFLSPRQSFMPPSSRRPSAASSEVDLTSRRATMPPALPASAPGTLEEKAFEEKRMAARLRPLSVASHCSSIQDISTLRPISFTPGRFPNHVETEKGPSFRKTFWAKMEIRKKRQLASEEPTPAVKTLSIMHILGSVSPRVGWPSRLGLVVACICAIIHAGATPAFAYVFSRLLATFYTAGRQQQQAQIYALTILGIAIADGLATYGFNALFDISAQTWANALKLESMRHILMQPREFFDREENSVSRLAECLDQFAEEARNLPGRFTGIAITVVAMIAIAVVWSFVHCWRLTIVALACGPILFAITRIYNAISSRWERFSNEADEQVGQVLHETFVNIRTVRCLVLEEVFRAKYNEATAGALKVGMKRAIYTGSIFGLNYSGTIFVSALLFWWGSYMISKLEYTPTQIIMAFNILMLSVAHVSWLGNYIPQINVSRDAGSRLMRLAHLPLDSHELVGTQQLFNAGEIALKDLNFTYPTREEHPVLHKVSFSIARGSCTAIVGTSGSGKSTIAALLLKLYQTDNPALDTSPDLTISGQDIKKLHTYTLRSRIAIVSQTPVLFPGTIAENITYGLSPSSQLTKSAKICAAASAAGVADFIDSLPQGYHTAVGEGGTGLSGGQAQRIAIARALVRDPDILILDEATSALDVESASIIRDTIQRLVTESKRDDAGEGPSARVGAAAQRRDMTVIIITHAREMMAIAEHVIMLDKGRVVEQGSFDELKRKRGPFSRLLRGEGTEVPLRGLG